MERSRDSDATDEALVEAAQGGDSGALELLLLRHESRVLRLLRLLGVPEAEREDVAQEVFVRVFRHLDGYRSGQSFRGWIYRIVVNASHDQRRRMRRRRRREADWQVDHEGSVDPGPGPAEELDRREQRRRLERLLSELSERERAVFVLCELEGLESGKVARSLAISTVTVRRHLGRARRRLERLLRARGEKTGER